MRLVATSASFLVVGAAAALSACAPAPSPPAPPPTPSSAPAPTVAEPVVSVAPAASSAAVVAAPGPLVLPPGFFVVAEAAATDDLSVVLNGDGDALIVAIDADARGSRGVRLHADAITPAPIVDGLLAALPAIPKGSSLGDLAILADGGAIARWDNPDGATRCQVLRRGPRSAAWTSLGAVPIAGDHCGPVGAWGEGAVAVSQTKPPGPISLVALGKTPKPGERRLSPSKAKDRCGVWSARVLWFATFPGGEAVTVGVPCGIPALTVERFAPGAKTSQAGTFETLMIDYPASATITSPTHVEVRRTVADEKGETAMVDVQLDFEKGAWKETSRKPSQPRPSGPTDKLTDKRYAESSTWVVGEDAYVLFRPTGKKTNLPQILARSRAVKAPIDFREAPPSPR